MTAEEDLVILARLCSEAIDHANLPDTAPAPALSAVMQQLVGAIPQFAKQIAVTAPYIAPEAFSIAIRHQMWICYELGRKAQAYGLTLTMEPPQ